MTRTEEVLNAIMHLVEEAAVILFERGVGGRNFSIALFRSDGHVARLSIETGQQTRDSTILGRLFRERIDALADPLDPGFGYDMIRLAVHVVEPLVSEQLQFDGGKGSEQELAALTDRLATRLGRNRIQQFIPVDTHIPEQAALQFSVFEPRQTDGSAQGGPCC